MISDKGAGTCGSLEDQSKNGVQQKQK